MSEVIKYVSQDNLNQFAQDMNQKQKTIFGAKSVSDQLVTDVDALGDALDDVVADIAVLDGRVDNITSLPAGSVSTSADAELVDIRVGANGITYNTAGDAVRGQYSELKSALDTAIDDATWEVASQTETKADYNWTIAGCNNYGANTSSTTRIVSNIGASVNQAQTDIHVKSSNPSVLFYVYERTASSGEMTGSGWLTEYTIAQGKYFKIIVRSNPEATITDIETSQEYQAISLLVGDTIKVYPKEYYPVKIVAKDGSAEFSTIQSAINAANDGDVIYIKSGWYEEAVVNTKQIALVGQDKYSTVLYNTTGEYATPPLWSCSGRIENLTIYAWNKYNVSFDSLTQLGYAFHLDQKWNADHDKRHIVIRNCIIKSDFNDCIGCGMDADAYIDISDTICEATHRSGMKVHPFPTTGSSKMILKNNVFKKGVDENAYGLLFHLGGTDGTTFNTITVEAYNNIAKTYDGFNSNCFLMSEYNYGNTLASMNRFSLG